MLPRRDLMLVLLICLVWAGNFLASASAMRHFPPLLFTALRMLVVLLVLMPWLKPVAPGMRLRLVAVALLTNVIHFGLNFWALRAAGDISSNAIALQSYIPMAALMAWWLLGEPIRWRSGLGIATAFLGVLVLGFDPLVLDAPFALVLCLSSAAVLALGMVLMRGLSGVHAFQLQAWSALMGVPLLTLSAAALEPLSLALLADARLLDWGGVVYSALGASLVGHGLLYVLVQRHPVALLSPFLLLTPVFAVALGVLVWGDRPGPRLWVGGALVLSGVLVVALRGRRKAMQAAPAR
ncbi:MAG: DMT family transporter [Xanthomonadales bacterium]|nr:DMT family transporter [Xanthomonadales bacterium]